MKDVWKYYNVKAANWRSKSMVKLRSLKKKKKTWSTKGGKGEEVNPCNKANIKVKSRCNSSSKLLACAEDMERITRWRDHKHNWSWMAVLRNTGGKWN